MIENEFELNEYLTGVESKLECVFEKIDGVETELGHELKCEIMNGYIDVFTTHETLTIDDFIEENCHGQIEFIVDEKNFSTVKDAFNSTLNEVEEVTGEDADVFYQKIKELLPN